MALTVCTATAEFLAVILRLHAATGFVALLTGRMIARREIVQLVGGGVFLHLHLAVVHRPQATFLLLLARRRRLPHEIDPHVVALLLLGEEVHL